MTEKQEINGKEVWLRVEVLSVPRDNPNIIPTEYFTASYYLEAPDGDGAAGVVLLDEQGLPKRFESPVAALTYAQNCFASGARK